MFGLSLEKLVVIALIVGIVIGPHRLPGYAQRLAEVVRGVRGFLEAARVRAETETGVPFSSADWNVLDPRQYDPRRIIREALEESSARTVPSAPTASSVHSPGSPPAQDAAPPAVDAELQAQDGTSAESDGLAQPDAPAVQEAAPIGRSPHVSGSSGHPRKLFAPVSRPQADVAESQVPDQPVLTARG